MATNFNSPQFVVERWFPYSLSFHPPLRHPAPPVVTPSTFLGLSLFLVWQSVAPAVLFSLNTVRVLLSKVSDFFLHATVAAWLTVRLVAVQGVQPVGEQLQHFALKNISDNYLVIDLLYSNMATRVRYSSQVMKPAALLSNLFPLPLQSLLFISLLLSSVFLLQLLVLCGQALQHREPCDVRYT